MTTMKIEYLAFPTDKFPCFGFAIGLDDDKLCLLPEYDKHDLVCNIKKTEIEDMYLFKYNVMYEIKKGDKRTYVYMLNPNEFIIGTLDNKRHEFVQALNKIQEAPFSKLELALALTSSLRIGNVRYLKKDFSDSS